MAPAQILYLESSLEKVTSLSIDNKEETVELVTKQTISMVN
jgi:hypothetical protein